MESIKVLSSFYLKNLGLLTELQHSLNGIPPGTILINSEQDEIWTVVKRVHIGELLVSNNETLFECETEFMHISHSFDTPIKRDKYISEEQKKRENGIYWYLLKPQKKGYKLYEGLSLSVVEFSK